MKNSEEKKVQVYKRVNKLKLKAGFGLDEDKVGFIDKSTILKAQMKIDQKENEYPATVEAVLNQLVDSWKELKQAPEDQRDELIDRIYNFSNNIKDLTATYQHDLMHHFSLSLRNFCEKIDVNKKEHHVIVQAHIDVMWITFNEKLKGEVGPKAEELKLVVSQAIRKYF